MSYKRQSRYIGYLLTAIKKPRKAFLIAIKEPGKVWQILFAIFIKILNILRYIDLYKVSRNVEGLIDLNLGILLYKSVLRAKSDSPNVVELGAFKGLSTTYLSLAASKVGKRVKSFESFSGLPTADPILDPTFQIGQHSPTIIEYEANLKAYGRRDVIDLVIGDAKQTMLPVIQDSGFCVAFLDVDVYEVTRELLFQLWSVVKGNEVIIIHDANSPGVRKAIDEFHALSGNIVTETMPVPQGEEGGTTAKLDIPLLNKHG